MAEDKILTLKEVADYPKLTERTLYRLTPEGTLPGCKVGKSWRFRLRDLDAWIEDQNAEIRREEGRR
jgi:excisionase family DNA binding protein